MLSFDKCKLKKSLLKQESKYVYNTALFLAIFYPQEKDAIKINEKDGNVRPTSLKSSLIYYYYC